MSGSDSGTESEQIEALVTAAAGGDRAAQERLLRDYWDVIRRAVRGRKSRMGQQLRAREATEDLAQGAALRVLAGLDGHEWRGKSAFAAWIKRIASSQVVDAYRHHAAGKRDAPEVGMTILEAIEAPNRSPESRLDGQRAFEELMAQVEALDPKYGAALVLHHLGFSHEEVGDVLDCSPEAARKLVARARTKLLAIREG